LHYNEEAILGTAISDEKLARAIKVLGSDKVVTIELQRCLELKPLEGWCEGIENE